MLLIFVGQPFLLIYVDAHFWQKGLMAEKAKQYEKCGERKQQSKDYWAKMAEIMVHKPTK